MTKEYIESLSAEELRRLLSSPLFRPVVLRIAAKSERLSRIVDEALDLDFAAMTPDQRQRIKRIADSVSLQHMPREGGHKPSDSTRPLIAAPPLNGVPAVGASTFAQILGLSQEVFSSMVLGYSELRPVVATATSPSTTLVACLDRLRGGTVIVEFHPSGAGVIRGRFRYPQHVIAHLIDVTRSSLVPLSIDRKPYTRIELQAGDSATHFTFTTVHEFTDGQFCLIVLAPLGPTR